MADSLCCAAENNATLWSIYTSIQILNKANGISLVRSWTHLGSIKVFFFTVLPFRMRMAILWLIHHCIWKTQAWSLRITGEKFTWEWIHPRILPTSDLVSNLEETNFRVDAGRSSDFWTYWDGMNALCMWEGYEGGDTGQERNTMNCICPQHLYVEDLTPRMTVFGVWASKEMIQVKWSLKIVS